jgi:hypothetical protein
MAKILIMYDHLICVPLKHIYFGRRNYRIEIINFSSNWQVLCLLVKYSLRSEISVGDLVQTCTKLVQNHRHLFPIGGSRRFERIMRETNRKPIQ